MLDLRGLILCHLQVPSFTVTVLVASPRQGKERGEARSPRYSCGELQENRNGPPPLLLVSKEYGTFSGIWE
jgi:hypothetical protein